MSDVHRGIGGSVWTVFEKSAHLAHLEESELFLAAVRDYLRRADSTANPADS